MKLSPDLYCALLCTRYDKHCNFQLFLRGHERDVPLLLHIIATCYWL